MRLFLIALFLFSTTAAIAGAGYKGLFAPSEDTPAAVTAPAPAAKPAETPKPSSSVLAPAAPQTMTPMPALTMPSTPVTGTPDTRLSEDQARQLSLPRTRIEGMLPTEYMAKKETDKLRAGLKDSSVTPEGVRKRLDTLARGFRAKLSVSDETYKGIGAPDVFIREEKEGATAALKIVEAMQKELEGK